MRNQTLGHDIQTESVALKLIEHDKPISFTSWDNVHKTKDFMFNQTKDFQNVHPGEEAGGRKPGEKRREFGVNPLPGCQHPVVL